MACFLVSAAEAVVVNAVKKGVEANEASAPERTDVLKVPFSVKLKWLSRLLCGGSVLLAFEHLWHGEIVPWFPFLTAMSSAEDTAEMLHEMATVGVGMAVLITVVWACMCFAADAIMRREPAGSGGVSA
ncbi:MAG: hypothetical protein J6Z30_05485 [Pyramidobacter sp.]|nr:hypothetical protein [Pyramidobacter sp.]